MRQRIYTRGDHGEVARNLVKLGECARAAGALDDAAARFRDARAMLQRLVLREVCVCARVSAFRPRGALRWPPPCSR